MNLLKKIKQVELQIADAEEALRTMPTWCRTPGEIRNHREKYEHWIAELKESLTLYNNEYAAANKPA